MSFSSSVKKEICSILEDRECCNKALLNAAFSFFNVINNNKIKMTTENAAVARFLNILIKKTFDVDSIIGFKKNRKLNCYSLEITNQEDIIKIGKGIGLINTKINQVSSFLNNDLSVNECCRKAAIKGAFIAAGSITDPQKSYHFEIVSHRQKLIYELAELFISLSIEPKIIKRASNYVLYIKEKEKIADILNILGAKKMFFKFYDKILEKEVRNYINRKQNFEQANLDKTVNASVLQVLSIEKIIKNNKFESLPEHLKKIARLRLENPQATLSELVSLLGEPITKSGINHRLKKLVDIGNELK